MTNTFFPPGYRFPPGVRFYPTDVELIMYYLKRKLRGKPSQLIADVDIYKYAPWDLPAKSYSMTKDLQWYFFCPRERKYPNGNKTQRATESGSWRTTGNDKAIHYKEKIVGMRKSLIFHTRLAPRGVRTNWVMHEYRLKDQDGFVICKIFEKSKAGPGNGEYGAPFNEEEWSDDEEADGAGSFPLACISSPVSDLQNIQESSVMTNTFVPGTTYVGSSSASNFLNSVQPPDCEDDLSMRESPLDDLDLMLANCTHDVVLAPDGNTESERLDDGIDIFNELDEIGKVSYLSYISTSQLPVYVGGVDGLWLSELSSPAEEGPSVISDPRPSNYYIEQPSYPVNSLSDDGLAFAINQTSMFPEENNGLFNHNQMFLSEGDQTYANHYELRRRYDSQLHEIGGQCSENIQGSNFYK